MHRLLRLSLFLVCFAALAISEASAIKPEVQVSGRVAPEEVRIFLKDSVYIINNEYVIGGTLIIEPGTQIYFYPNGRMIDSTGGRIIADGFAKATYTANPQYQMDDGTVERNVNIDPTYITGTKNPLNWTGYADFDYVLYGLDEAADEAALQAWHGDAHFESPTIDILTERETTVHADKYNHIFNVRIDNRVENGRNKRDIVNLDDPFYVAGADEYIIPYEVALMVKAARLEQEPDDDISLNTLAWKRLGKKSVNIGEGSDEDNQIQFIGRPVNNHSREWGHIIVLPGARAAFFRNCKFEGFRKDTTVDRMAIYNEAENPNWEWAKNDRQKVNNALRYLTNGAGGAITTFSSRTWLLDCEFRSNMARRRGGAVQILQAPAGFPVDNVTDVNGNIINLYDIYSNNIWNVNNTRYAIDKNPCVTGPDANQSDINIFWAARNADGSFQTDVFGHLVEGTEGVADPNTGATPVAVSRLPRIDNIDESNAFPEPTFNFANDPTLADYYRQAYDDGRLAVYLGRMRNLKFVNNFVRLANVGTIYINTPPIPVVTDILDQPADSPQEYGDYAYGGAIYIASDNNSHNRIDWLEDDPWGQSWLSNRNQIIEVAFGVNNKIWTSNSTIALEFKHDEFTCDGNRAYNYSEQAEEPNKSLGARGGAIYVGDYTSLIVAGQINNNGAFAEFLVTEESNPNKAFMFAMGGGIYAKQTKSRLQVRGGPGRQENLVDNPTEFKKNVAAAGGAIAIDDNLDLKDNYVSPVIGGSDFVVPARDYGYNVKFEENMATYFGGAVYTNRNTTVNGAGGVEVNTLIGYGGKFPVIFEKNYAGFAGGALDIRLSSNADLEIGDRTVSVIRTVFRENEVGTSMNYVDNKPMIRGGGALYSMYATLNVVKGTQFIENKVKNGNGGAIAMIHPQPILKRFFITDIDDISIDPVTGFEINVDTEDEVFTYRSDAYPPDSRMLTQFIGNVAEAEPELQTTENGSGATQIGAGSQKTTDNMFAIDFQSHSEGFIAGENGTIIKMSNGGLKWEYKNAGTDKKINYMTFPTSDLGFLIGEDGTIIVTDDGGASWSTPNSVTWSGLNPGDMPALYDMSITSNVCYIVGEDGTVLKSEDNGENWYQLPEPTQKDLKSVYFSGEYGYVVGESGVLLKSNNAGDTWTEKTIGGTNTLNAIYFTGVNEGYVIGTNGLAMKTYNGGDSWKTLSTGTEKDLNAFSFAVDNNTIFAVGADGTILRTTNGGENWESVGSDEFQQDLNGVFVATKLIVYAVGNEGTIIKTTDGGDTWFEVKQTDRAIEYVERWHQETKLPENGIGLGGAMYIVDQASVDRIGRPDSLFFNRVRFQDNVGYSGACVYSDNYDLKLVFSKSLIANNIATSEVGMMQNAIYGPFFSDDGSGTMTTYNQASSDLAGAIIYGEVQGPLPATKTNIAWSANSIHSNKARFIVRLPDAPNSKGNLAGTTGIGFGGTDTLRGNYWGRTEANVVMSIENLKDDINVDPNNPLFNNVNMETFYVNTNGQNTLNYAFWQTPTDLDKLQENEAIGDKYLLYQGPFESIDNYEYIPIPLLNDGDENTPSEYSIPEKLLQSGYVYDVYDKGTDIKAADYSKRRMVPIEDFAVGIPPRVQRFNDADKPSFGKYVRRLVRDPAIADSITAEYDNVYPYLHDLQTEFNTDEDGRYYHPLGYPVFLETMIDYDDIAQRSNHDPSLRNETVFFMVNEATGDYIRVPLKQVSDQAPLRDLFRARVELVPDLTSRTPAKATQRRTDEGLLNLGRNSVLLGKIRHNPMYEDGGALVGRKYIDIENGFANVTDLYHNRPDMPETNTKPNEDNPNYETYFAGERYNSLPVNVGDPVRVVSRTVLWTEDVGEAFDDGILFYVTESTEPPIYTGDIVTLMTDTLRYDEASQYPWRNQEGEWDEIEVLELLNTVFITEDRYYPVPEYMYSNPREARKEYLSVFDKYVDKYGNRLFYTDYNDEYGTTVGDDAVGRDKILDATAIDNNNFYDPRFMHVSSSFSKLEYHLEVPNNSGLKHWLVGENTFGEDGHLILRGRATNPFVVPGGEKAEIHTYNFPPNWRTIDSLKALNMVLKANGQDTIATDTLDKFINVYRSYLNTPKYNEEFARYLQQDTIDVGMNNFRGYEFTIFVVDSAPTFLNPIIPHPDYGEGAEEKYWSTDVVRQTNCRTEIDQNGNEVEVCDDIRGRFVTIEIDSEGNLDTLGALEPSVYHCYRESDGRIRANLTDKLRFQMDFNTDDEWEDSWAEANGWDFRYGKTAYGFMKVSYRPDVDAGTMEPDSITVIDTVVSGETNYDGNRIVVEKRPVWMDNQFMYRYDSEDDADKDVFGSDFTYGGKINIRIDKDLAMSLLTPKLQYNDALNTDTVFTVMVNDGHGGMNSMEMPVMINVEPKILTEDLPPATEDVEYNNTENADENNYQMLDSNKIIKFFDANFDQNHIFELVYEDYEEIGTMAGVLQINETENEDGSVTQEVVIPRDPCFSEAGSDLLERRTISSEGDTTVEFTLMTTPKWLMINEESGLLYGTPGVKDAPRVGANAEDITVICWDEDSLRTIQTYTLEVFPTEHQPDILAAMKVQCLELNKDELIDTMVVYDRDLMRGRVDENGDPIEEKGKNITDTLTISFEDANGNAIGGISAEPNPVIGIEGYEFDGKKVEIKTDKDSFNPSRDDGDSRTTIYIVITDKAGNTKKEPYTIMISDETDFVCDIKVMNSKGAYQILQFGTASLATAGDGLDGELIGQLDDQYCEYEIPPIPYGDIFDARWSIGNTKGILRNMFFTGDKTTPNGGRIYRARFQAGGEDGGTSNCFPITISWNKSDVPAIDDEDNPNNSIWVIRDIYSKTEFFYNMNTGEGESAVDIIKEEEGDEIKIIILRDKMEGFAIEHIWDGIDVKDQTADVETGLINVSPNPLTVNTTINYGLMINTRVRIEIIDNLGNVVNILEDAEMPAGLNHVEWDGRDMSGRPMANGSYTCRMVAGSVTSTMKIIINR